MVFSGSVFRYLEKELHDGRHFLDLMVLREAAAIRGSWAVAVIALAVRLDLGSADEFSDENRFGIFVE